MTFLPLKIGKNLFQVKLNPKGIIFLFQMQKIQISLTDYSSYLLKLRTNTLLNISVTDYLLQCTKSPTLLCFKTWAYTAVCAGPVQTRRACFVWSLCFVNPHANISGFAGHGSLADMSFTKGKRKPNLASEIMHNAAFLYKDKHFIGLIYRPIANMLPLLPPLGSK